MQLQFLVLFQVLAWSEVYQTLIISVAMAPLVRLSAPMDILEVVS
jgi:hypothetical protein